MNIRWYFKFVDKIVFSGEKKLPSLDAIWLYVLVEVLKVGASWERLI